MKIPKIPQRSERDRKMDELAVKVGNAFPDGTPLADVVSVCLAIIAFSINEQAPEKRAGGRAGNRLPQENHMTCQPGVSNVNPTGQQAAQHDEGGQRKLALSASAKSISVWAISICAWRSILTTGGLPSARLGPKNWPADEYKRKGG